MSRAIKTPKGTELQLRDIHGQDYLDVKYRIVWFREEYPLWSIETEFVEKSEKHALIKATVKDENGRVRATGHGHENQQGFKDFREKAETAAIGRALAHIGIGTVNAIELEEGEKIVDAPAFKRAHGSQPVIHPVSHYYPPVEAPRLETYIVPFGKKYKGRKLTEIPKEEVQKYLDWLQEEIDKSGEVPNSQTKDFILMADKYLEKE